MGDWSGNYGYFFNGLLVTLLSRILTERELQVCGVERLQGWKPQGLLEFKNSIDTPYGQSLHARPHVPTLPLTFFCLPDPRRDM